MEEDIRTVAKLIQDRISQLKRDRDINHKEQERLRIEEQKHKDEQQLQQDLRELKVNKEKQQQERDKQQVNLICFFVVRYLS